jgi:hypothetical protein
MITSGPISSTMFIGLSTDQKPSSGVEFSCKFYEYDTGTTFIWTGSSAQPAMGQWVEYAPLFPSPDIFGYPTT